MLGEEQGFRDQMPNTGIWIGGFSYVSEVRVSQTGIRVCIMRNIQSEKGISGKYTFQFHSGI